MAGLSSDISCIGDGIAKKSNVGQTLVLMVVAGSVAWAFVSYEPGSQSNPRAPAFVESDFYWDEKTAPHQDTIVTMVNRIARTVDDCESLDPSSAYVSDSRSTDSRPAFYVTCYSGSRSFNVFFTTNQILP